MIRKNWILFFSLLLVPLTAGAGSYMRSGGEGFASVGLAMDLGDRLFDKQGERVGSSCDPGQTLSVYGEYGWSYHTTVFAGGALRHETCNSGDKWGMEGGRIGINGRINPVSNAWVWETALLLPSQRFGSQSASRDAFGLEAGLHYHPRPDPYDLSRAIDPLESAWDFGIGVKAWFKDLPQELWAYGQYTLPLQETNWNLGQGGWTASARLDYSRSLGHTRNTTPFAVDSFDTFWRLDLGLSLKHPLSKNTSLRIGAKTSLAGQNTGDSSEINFQYEKTFPK